ncbi:MAG: hypothetical protein AMXMBFR64_17740 [Myxococcales bacterium]
MPRPLCFVLMPFGHKPDSTGRIIDFDRVFRQIIAPAIEAAGLEPLRADQEAGGGIIHKAMFERLVLCQYAVADLTTANANVYYELGVRHAVRPCSTVLVRCEGERLPFDVAPDRSLAYTLGADGRPSKVAATIGALQAALEAVVGRSAADSPVYQLLDCIQPPVIDHTRTDVFRDLVEYSNDVKRRLGRARRAGVNAVRAEEHHVGDLARAEAGVLIDLLLSYRAVESWGDMVRLAESIPEPVKRTVLVREQLGLALNRAGRGEEAEAVLLELIAERGGGSETFGILGRVYKDRWTRALRDGHASLAAGQLDRAISAYLHGFEADFRDSYPGVNCVTLMEVRTPPDERRHELLPVVRYAVTRKMAGGTSDYWDHATLLELAVLGRDEAAAGRSLSAALPLIRESWEPKTTANNLRAIREARAARGEAVPWADSIEEALLHAGP